MKLEDIIPGELYKLDFDPERGETQIPKHQFMSPSFIDKYAGKLWKECAKKPIVAIDHDIHLLPYQIGVGPTGWPGVRFHFEGDPSSCSYTVHVGCLQPYLPLFDGDH